MKIGEEIMLCFKSQFQEDYKRLGSILKKRRVKGMEDYNFFFDSMRILVMLNLELKEVK